jgi:hypothetical protein
MHFWLDRMGFLPKTEINCGKLPEGLKKRSMQHGIDGYERPGVFWAGNGEP